MRFKKKNIGRDRDNLLKKTTEKIGELNAKRVELANLEEKIRNEKEDERLTSERLVKAKQELQKIENEIIIKTKQAESMADLSSGIIARRQELSKLKESITGQIEANRVREEEELAELRSQTREAQEDHREFITRQSVEISTGIKLKQKLLDEISSLQETKKAETKLLENISVRRLEQEVKIVNEDARITGRQHELNDEEKRLSVYRDRLQRWAKKLNVQLRQ